MFLSTENVIVVWDKNCLIFRCIKESESDNTKYIFSFISIFFYGKCNLIQKCVRSFKALEN